VGAGFVEETWWSGVWHGGWLWAGIEAEAFPGATKQGAKILHEGPKHIPIVCDQQASSNRNPLPPG